MGDVLDTARTDWQRFSNSGGFNVEITFKSPLGVIAVINGLATKHHLGVDTDGSAVNSKNVHVSVSESLLTAAGYPVRNSGGEVSMHNHKVKFADSTGNINVYSISEGYPDEHVGMLTFILVDRNTEFESPVLSISPTGTQLELSWTFGGSGHSNFEIWRQVGPAGVFALLQTVSDVTLSYDDAAVVSATIYTYQVRAISGAEKGDFSNPVSGQLAVADDGTVTLNGGDDIRTDVPSGGTADITVENQNAVQLLDSTTDGLGTVTVPIFNRAGLIKSGQTTSQVSGDDGNLRFGRLSNITTLDEPNIFGNLERFTDELGGQTYALGIMIDHAFETQITNAFIGYFYRDTSTTLVNQITAARVLTLGTFSDWESSNAPMALSLVKYETYSNSYGHLPISISNAFHTSTFGTNSTRNLQGNPAKTILTDASSGSNRRGLFYRIFTWNGTALT